MEDVQKNLQTFYREENTENKMESVVEIETFEKVKHYQKDLNLYKKKEFFDLYAHKIRAIRFQGNEMSNQLGEELIEGY